MKSEPCTIKKAHGPGCNLHTSGFTALMILLLTAALPAITQPALADTGPTDEEVKTDKTDPDARWDALMKVLAATFSETAKLNATSPVLGDNLGASVSIEGDFALVGAPGTPTGTGVAYIFKLIGAAWTQVATLTPTLGSPDDKFGASVSLSGNRALIGAPGNDAIASGAGAVYVFHDTDPGPLDWTGTSCCTAGDDTAGLRPEPRPLHRRS